MERVLLIIVLDKRFKLGCMFSVFIIEIRFRIGGDVGVVGIVGSLGFEGEILENIRRVRNFILLTFVRGRFC